jgi:hypothetical protein
VSTKAKPTKIQSKVTRRIGLHRDEGEMNEVMMWSLEFRKQSSRWRMDGVHGLSSSSLALLALRGCPRGWRGARLG